MVIINKKSETLLKAILNELSNPDVESFFVLARRCEAIVALWRRVATQQARKGVKIK